MEKQLFFYIDIRAAGKGYEEFVKRVQGEFQVNYIRGKVSKVYKDVNGDLVATGSIRCLNKKHKNRSYRACFRY